MMECRRRPSYAVPRSNINMFGIGSPALSAFVGAALLFNSSILSAPTADAFAPAHNVISAAPAAAALAAPSSHVSAASSTALSALLTAGDNTVPATVNFGPEGPSGLSGVKNIIAVSSCKGGVGKSTTSVNLAYSLKALGYKVGIFDADLFGPSLPTMITPDDDNVRFVERQIAPLENNGVKLMSFGYVNDGSAIMRGPMVTQLLDQFLSMVHWGDVDYLILDMPPGTGDVQLTLTQRLDITAAVIVTTPQELSFVDVERGVEMFNTVNVPCIAVVENMAYIEPTMLPTSAGTSSKADEESSDDEPSDMDMNTLAESFIAELMANDDIISTKTDDDMDKVEQLAERLVDIVEKSKVGGGGGAGGANAAAATATQPERIQIFGKGHRDRLASTYGIENTFSVPLLDKIASHGDSGKPFVLENPTSNVADIYKSLAESVVGEVAKLAEMTITRPSVRYDDKEHIITVMDVQPLQLAEEEGDGETEKSDDIDVARVPPAELRRDCRCAACVEELTNKQLLDPASVPDSVHPVGELEQYGNYALSVNWSDGHKSLYPYTQIRELVRDVKSGKTVAETKKDKVL